MDIDFESATVGDTIADGGVFGGVTFNYSWTSGESIRINDDNSTTSGTNYLGATNGAFSADLMADFNDITFAPNSPFSAFGLFISAPFEPFDDDLVLSGSSGAQRTCKSWNYWSAVAGLGGWLCSLLPGHRDG